MNTFTKTTLALLATSVMATSSFASTSFGSNDDSPREVIRTAKASVEALANTLENQGVAVNANVDVSGLSGYAQKEQAYQDKYDELQAQFNELNS